MKELLKSMHKRLIFYSENIILILLGWFALLLLGFGLLLMEWFTNSFPVVSLIICVLIFFAANKITKNKRYEKL